MTGVAQTVLRRTVTALGPSADSLLPSWRSSLTRGLTVFVFHEVTASPSQFHREHGTYTTPDVLRHQLAWIKTRFRVIEPPSLPQLGGSGDLPTNAALLTFDDSWAGTARLGVPMLREMNLPALWFLNVATIQGDPDLAAVRGYERAASKAVGLNRLDPIDAGLGTRLIEQIRDRYRDDPAFRAYEGPTADSSDLRATADTGMVWFGSHLYHHWNVRLIRDDLYEDALAKNAQELDRYPNTLPAFALPHGYAGEDGRDIVTVAARAGVKLIFTGRGTQNAQADGAVIDRVLLPAEPSTARGWWHATHLARIVGPRKGRDDA